MNQWLQSGKRRFFIDEAFGNTLPKPLTEFEKSAFEFIHDWLNGREIFTLHTSGSTGMPKPIEVNRAQLKASAALTINALGLLKNQTALICLDTRYVAGVMMLVRSLEAGMNMVFIEPCSNPMEKIDDDELIDFVALVPLQVETIIHSTQRNKFERIKNVLIGGAALNTSTLKELQTLRCACFATYGMTETLSHIALQRLNGMNAEKYFTALPGIELKKDDRDCLVITAPHLSSAAIYTNDLVELLSPNTFIWIGRADNIINTGGVKVIPEKVESVIQSALDKLAIRNRFFLTGIPDAKLGNAVTLVIEGKELTEENETLLLNLISESLSKFEIPRQIKYIDEFVQTPTAKVNKPETIRLLSRE